MKTLTGKIITSTPVSVSRAASVLSQFVSADTGASDAITAYLRRASTVVTELSLLYKRRHHSLIPSSSFSVAASVEPEKWKENVEGNLVNSGGGERKKKRKKEEADSKSVGFWDSVNYGGLETGNAVEEGESDGVEEEKKKKRKKKEREGKIGFEKKEGEGDGEKKKNKAEEDAEKLRTGENAGYVGKKTKKDKEGRNSKGELVSDLVNAGEGQIGIGVVGGEGDGGKKHEEKDRQTSSDFSGLVDAAEDGRVGNVVEMGEDDGGIEIEVKTIGKKKKSGEDLVDVVGGGEGGSLKNIDMNRKKKKNKYPELESKMEKKMIVRSSNSLVVSEGRIGFESREVGNDGMKKHKKDDLEENGGEGVTTDREAGGEKKEQTGKEAFSKGQIGDKKVKTDGKKKQKKGDLEKHGADSATADREKMLIEEEQIVDDVERKKNKRKRRDGENEKSGGDGSEERARKQKKRKDGDPDS